MSRRKRNEDSSPLPPFEPNQRCRSHHPYLAHGLAAAWRRGACVGAGARRSDGGVGRVAGASSHCTARMLHGILFCGGFFFFFVGGCVCVFVCVVVVCGVCCFCVFV